MLGRLPRLGRQRHGVWFRASVRIPVYRVLMEAARTRDVSATDACNQALWLWAHVVRELDAPGVVRLRLVHDEEGEEGEIPPGTIHVQRLNGERIRVLPPPWIGRPDEDQPSSNESWDPGALQPAFPPLVYRLAVRFAVANAVLFVLTVLAVLSIVKVLGPR